MLPQEFANEICFSGYLFLIIFRNLADLFLWFWLFLFLNSLSQFSSREYFNNDDC